MRRALAGALAAAVVLAGCAESDDGTPTSTVTREETAREPPVEPTTEQAPETTEDKKPEPAKEKPKVASFEECLENFEFDVERRDDNLIRATPSGGGAWVNIDEFPTAREARVFDRQLEVPNHFQIGKRVAIGPADALDSVELCMRIEAQN